MDTLIETDTIVLRLRSPTQSNGAPTKNRELAAGMRALDRIGKRRCKRESSAIMFKTNLAAAGIDLNTRKP